jgi:hypothetical protein
MAETVVKQLYFSPVANTPPHQQAFGLQQVQQRLDARADWAAGNGAAASGKSDGLLVNDTFVGDTRGSAVACLSLEAHVCLLLCI